MTFLVEGLNVSFEQSQPTEKYHKKTKKNYYKINISFASLSESKNWLNNIDIAVGFDFWLMVFRTSIDRVPT